LQERIVIIIELYAQFYNIFLRELVVPLSYNPILKDKVQKGTQKKEHKKGKVQKETVGFL